MAKMHNPTSRLCRGEGIGSLETFSRIPLAMQEALIDGRLKQGDLVLLASVGAGFTVGTAGDLRTASLS